MADIRLHLRGGDVPTLPDVCLQCGAPTTERQARTFSWSPPWTCVLALLCSPLMFAVVALILMKRRRFEVPLCAEHRDWWRWRQHTLMGSLIFNLIGGGFFSLYLAASDSPNETWLIAFVGIGIGLLVWLAALVGLRLSRPLSGKITNTSFTLKGVAEEFARAQQWGGVLPSPQLDEEARKHFAPNEPQLGSDTDKHIQPAEERRTPPDALREGTP